VTEDTLPRLHILVVDDNGDARYLYRRLLEHRGAEVTECDSGPAGLAALARRVPDLIIADLAMPKMDGIEFIRAVRRLPGPVGQVPAICITSFGRAEYRQRAREAGYQAFLVKPFDMDQLLAASAALRVHPPDSVAGGAGGPEVSAGPD
jgi:two-component system chemotaxis response regulator CheY